MAQTVAQVYSSNLEVMRKDLPTLYEMAEKNTAVAMISKASEKFQISKTPNGADFRIPVEVQPPSDFGTFSVDGGSLGTGNSTVTQQMSQTAFPLRMAVDLGLGAILSTDTKGTATVNQLENNLKKAMKSFKQREDASFFNMTSGNQGLMALATGYSGGVFTLDTEFAASLCQVGQTVEIFSNDLATHRTSAVASNLPVITKVAHDRTTVTVGNLGAITPGTTDYLAFPGVTATPAWLNGLYYFHSTTTSGTILGLSRATYPELIPTFHDASGALTPATFALLNTKVFNRTGDIPPSMKGIINPAQALQIYSVGMAISEWMRGKSDEMIDVVPKMNDRYITVGGVVHLKSNKQSKKRVDWVNLDNWGRVYIKELDFHTDPDGKIRFFEGRDSSGNVTANWKFFLLQWSNFFNANPGQEAFIYNATIPTSA